MPEVTGTVRREFQSVKNALASAVKLRNAGAIPPALLLRADEPI
jgi:hypothetical protein